MIFEQPQQLGFSITSPFKAVGHGIAKGVKATGHGVAVGARATGHGIKKGAKAVGHIALIPLKALEDITLKPLLKPVRNRLHTLTNRRAAKLAWDRRQSKTPNAAEQAEAKSWTKSRVHGEIPFGPILSALAGANESVWTGPAPLGGSQLGDPATVAAVAASVPPMLILLNTIISKSAKSGEAPDHVGGGGAQSSGTKGGNAPGGVNLPAVQDAAEDAAGAVAGEPPVVHLPGGLKVRRSYLLIGGVVLGGLVVVSLLRRKS